MPCQTRNILLSSIMNTALSMLNRLFHLLDRKPSFDSQIFPPYREGNLPLKAVSKFYQGSVASHCHAGATRTGCFSLDSNRNPLDWETSCTALPFPTWKMFEIIPQCVILSWYYCSFVDIWTDSMLYLIKLNRSYYTERHKYSRI